ncbi:MAG: Hsp20/alpha crystallin family protein [Deltaproteobacteria bacterium]|nr:MAG: Hsp20/alpha crystallin family protein [Deltaproteobacteria bacterium]
MVLLRWRDPFERTAFSELNRLQEEMNMLFDRIFGRRSLLSGAGVFPAVNVAEDNDNVYVTAEMPGINPKDIELTVEEDSVVIKGERKLEEEGEGISYHRREREGGSFNRTITLPTRIVAEKASAEVRNGVLTLTLPKAEEAKPKKIEIKVG